MSAWLKSVCNCSANTTGKNWRNLQTKNDTHQNTTHLPWNCLRIAWGSGGNFPLGSMEIYVGFSHDGLNHWRITIHIFQKIQWLSSNDRIFEVISLSIHIFLSCHPEMMIPTFIFAARKYTDKWCNMIEPLSYWDISGWRPEVPPFGNPAWQAKFFIFRWISGSSKK